MIGTVEQKFRTASNGTEFTNNQPLLMDGVMIQHIVFLEQQRVSYKIIINSIVTNLYSRILYNSIKIYGLLISVRGYILVIIIRYVSNIVYFLNRKPIAVPAKSQKGILPLSK